MSWWIKGKDDTVKAIAHALEYNGEWMGESYVSVTIESPTPIAFAIGDYIIYRGERFEINYNPGKIKSAPQFAKGDAFKYENVKFNALADELTRCDFLDVVLSDNQLHFTGLPKFSFYGGVQDLANRIQANLNRAYPNQWTVVVSSDYTGDKELNVSIDTQKVWDALSILVNDFEAYFTIKGRTITIGAAGVPAGHLFKYGKGNGLYEIEQNADADQAIVTRLRAYGSTRNLPHRYYNKLTSADGKKLIPDNMAVQYLMLPSFPYTTQDPYIDSVNKAALGIREGTIFFDGSQEELEEIYPSIEGMTAEQLKAAGVPCDATGALDVVVSAEQMTDDGVGKINEENSQTEATPPTFKVTLKDLGFDIWEHRTSETPTISFKTGMLGGRDFEIVDCKKEGNNYVLELNRIYDDGIKLWFPYKDYNAKADDKFVLLYIDMPEVYIKAAAQRLLEAATAWLAKNDYSRSIYAPKVDEIFMARQHDEAIASGGSIISLHDTLKEGMLLLFEDDDLNIDASIFIDRLTIKEGNGSVPTYEVVLKEEKTVGRLDKMQNQIDSLTSGKGQGGYTASQIRQMIDAYGGQRFLSKLKDDRSKGKIASDLGFEVGNYLAGVSGGMLGLDTNNGESFADVFRLWVRGKAYFETLTTIESKTLAGKQYITPGGSIRCTKVEEVKNAQGAVTDYRCYFLSEQDGEKTDTKIIVGDQAISEMFNAKTGTSNKVSNHRYWRLVTAVNNDAYTDDAGNHYGYIDLSASDCEGGSDIPKSGDSIAQLGYRDSDRPERQTAMIFSTVDPDAPSIKMFGGINSYTLSGKAIIAFGQDAVTHKVYFRLGADGAAQYLDYSQDKGLTLAGSLSVNTTISDKTLNDYFTDLIPEIPDPYDDTEIKEEIDKYKYLRNALLPENPTQITGGLVMSTLISLGYTDASNIRHTLAGMNGGYVPTLRGRTIGSWWGGPMVDLFDVNDTKKNLAAGTYATSMVRMDGSAYWANGNVGFRKDGSGWLASDNITWDANGAITFGNGIKINLGGDAKGLTESIASVTNLANAISNLFTPYNGTTAHTWQDVLNGADFDAIKVERAFFTDFSLAGKGATAPGGSGGGGGSLFGLYTDTTWVSTPAESDALSAVLGKSLHARVSVLEGAGYLTAITKAMVEAVLTGDVTSHTHSQYLTQHQSLADYYTKSQADTRYARQAAPNNFMHSGDEMTFVPSGYSFPIWINYQTVGGTNGAITEYRFGNGSGGAYADVRAKRFIVNGGTASQFLMANGSLTTKVTANNITNTGWQNNAVDDLRVPTMSFLAYWNGAHTNGGTSNLKYCDRGRFGDVVTRSATLTATASTVPLRNTDGLLQLPAICDSRELSAHVKAAGWYRVFTSSISDAGGSNILLSISRNFSLSNCETYQFAISVQTYSSSYTPCITQLSGTISSHFIPKIRIVQKFNSIFYIDIYCVNGIRDIVYVSGFGAGTFTAPTAGATIPDGYTAIEYSTCQGFKTNYAINSGVATGKAPFAVLSSTMVSNLNADLLDGLHATDFTRKSSLTMSAGGVARVALPESGCLISIRGLNGGRGALVWVTGYYDGTSVRNTARIIYSSSNYAFYFNGTSESSGCVYVKSLWTSGTDTITVTALQGSHPSLTSVGAVPSDATLIGSSATLAALTDNVASATNADMLDNLHAIDFARSSRVGNVDLNTLTTSGIYGTGGSCTNAPDKTPWGQLLVLHGQGDTPIAQMMFSYNVNGLVYVRAGSPTNTGGKGSWGAWKQLALIDSNVASATNADKLDNKHGLEYQRDLYTYHNTQGFADTTVNPNILSSATGLSGFRYFDTKFYNIVSPSASRFQIAYPYADAGTISYRTYYNSAWSAWQHLARTTDNVASASKLYNDSAFTAWGQIIFQNGVPKSISGELQHVTAIRFDSGNALVEGFGNAWNLWSVNGFSFYPSLSATVSALTVTPNGRVGVNMFSPVYDFDVTGVIHASGEIFSDKAIGGKGMTSSSDIRLKHIVGDVELSFEAILNSPSKRFTWLGGADKNERIGTTAQYWLPILPQVVYTSPDGYYAVDYGTLANAKADTIAHVVAKLVERLNKLERQLNTRA